MNTTKLNSIDVFIKFNFNKSCIWIDSIRFYWWWEIYLTLTRVVFEYVNIYGASMKSDEFNFNKSCIWISYLHLPYDLARHLTLTRVVFEC